SQREAVAALRIGAGEQPYVRQVVDLALGLDLRNPDAANAQSADVERVGGTFVFQRAAAGAAAADIGGLDLPHLDRAVRHLSFQLGVRPDGLVAAASNQA